MKLKVSRPIFESHIGKDGQKSFSIIGKKNPSKMWVYEFDDGGVIYAHQWGLVYYILIKGDKEFTNRIVAKLEEKDAIFTANDFEYCLN